jgi:hypothetical protein
MRGCFCFPFRRPEHTDERPVFEEEVLKYDFARETSIISLFSCVETESSATSADRATVEEARRRLDLLKSYIADDSFTLNSRSKTVTLWHKNEEPLISRGRTTIEDVFDLDLVVDAITNLERVKRWDPDTVHQERLSEVSLSRNKSPYMKEFLHKTYCAYKGRMGFPGRDFVWNTLIAWESDSLVYLVNYSEQEGAPESKPGFVRGKTKVAGYRIQRCPNGIVIDFTNQVDIGSKLVPDFILTPIMKKVPERLAALAEYIHIAHREK